MRVCRSDASVSVRVSNEHTLKMVLLPNTHKCLTAIPLSSLSRLLKSHNEAVNHEHGHLWTTHLCMYIT